MRWIKHSSAFCRSSAMSEVRERLGPAGYGAVWLLLERIAEAWNGKNEPDLQISEREWAKTCGLSAKKLQDLLEILKEHGIILSETANFRLRLTAPILLELQDEWTARTRRNSGETPEPLRSDSGIQQNTTDKEKNRDRHSPPPSRAGLIAVLLRHGIRPDSEKAGWIIRHIEAKQPNNPGGYLESILQQKPHFDPMPEDPPTETNNRQQGLVSVGDVLRGMGMPPPPRSGGGP